MRFGVRLAVTKACCWMQVPMLLVYMCVHRFYTRSYIELQRIDAVSTASDHLISPATRPCQHVHDISGLCHSCAYLILPGHSSRRSQRQAAARAGRLLPTAISARSRVAAGCPHQMLCGRLLLWWIADFIRMCRSHARRCTAILQRVWRAWTPSAPTAIRAALRS